MCALPTKAGAAALSIVPIILLLIAFNTDAHYFQLLGIALCTSLITSVLFFIYGVKAGLKWMLAWGLFFVLMMPIANLAFWILHLRKAGR